MDAIKTVNEREKADSENAGLIECFQKPNWRRTEIAAMAMITQQSVGQQLISFGVKLLQSSGISQAISLWCVFAVFAAYGAANLGSIWIMTRFGRRQGWLWGLSGIVICLLTMGTLGFTGGSCWVLAGVTVLFGFIFNFTVGPISFTIVAETPSSRLKTATNGAARGCFIILSMANTILCQYCLGPPPEALGLGCKSAYIWAGTTTACLAWSWYRLPEMKGRTPAEIDILFEQKVARKCWPEQRLD